LGSVNTVVVGLGRDLRPIEPVRIGYYPGVCKALGIPCNTPPRVPRTKCGESLQCTGMAAQCFSGGSWSHKEPEPGRNQCVECFQNRLPHYEDRFPDAHKMVKNWCPQERNKAFDFIRCFCGLDTINANPFSPWPTTTTTTLPLVGPTPLPPYTPTPAPPYPGPACELPRSCIVGLESPKKCYNIKRNGGHNCYKGIKLWEKQLTTFFLCPNFTNGDEPIFESKAFCWCGLDNSPSPGPPSPSPGPPSPSPGPPSPPWCHWCPSCPSCHGGAQAHLASAVGNGLCNNGYDRHILRSKPKWLLQQDTFYCGQKVEENQDKVTTGAACMQKKEHITQHCAHCFGLAIDCSYKNCEQQCACSPAPPHESKECHGCVQCHCQKLLNWCTGLPSFATDLTDGWSPALAESKDFNQSDSETYFTV